MKLTIKNTDGGDAGSVVLPEQFSEPLREDLIIRSVVTLQANRRQPYGGYGDAGLRHSADLSKRRRAYRGAYGRGQSRVPRKVHSRRGSQMYYVGAIVAGTVGGRRAHGPKPFKDWSQKVNVKENRKAIRSALAATMNKELVVHRGHQLPDGFPFGISDDFDKISKTKDLEAAMIKLGLAAELVRGSEKRVRAGKGTMRGRKHKRPVSVLFVTAAGGTELEKAVSNIPGAEVVPVNMLNAEVLAPGTHPGRLTLFTKSAVDRLAKEGLYTNSYKADTEEIPVKPKKSKKKAKSKKTKKKSKKAKAKKSGKKDSETPKTTKTKDDKISKTVKAEVKA